MNKLSNDLIFDRHELSGSLADLGVFLPLAIALITLNGVSATPLFLAAGLAYVLAGLYFRIPMPVQPLKAACVIAITMAASTGVISATALSMAAVLLIVRFSGAGKHVMRLFPRAIIRGIQLSIGLILTKKGLALLFDERFFFGGEDFMFRILVFSAPFGVIIGLAAFIIILALRKSKNIPAGLALISFGLLTGVLAAGQDGLSAISIGPDFAALAFPKLSDFYVAVPALLIPQLPLTFGNSIAATEETAKQYFDAGAKRVTVNSLLTSIGLMNLFAGLIGGIPMCHGSGGLTAHHKFGARSGGSSVIIGTTFIIVALLFGRSATAVFGLIPLSILGAMLIYIGVMHTLLIKDIVRSPWDLALAALMAAITLAGGGLALAFLVAIIIYALSGLIKKER